MKVILSLIDKDCFIQAIHIDCNGNIEEVQITHNAFKAKVYNVPDLDRIMNLSMSIKINNWISEKHNTIVEIKTIL